MMGNGKTCKKLFTFQYISQNKTTGKEFSPELTSVARSVTRMQLQMVTEIKCKETVYRLSLRHTALET